MQSLIISNKNISQLTDEFKQCLDTIDINLLSDNLKILSKIPLLETNILKNHIFYWKKQPAISLFHTTEIYYLLQNPTSPEIFYPAISQKELNTWTQNGFHVDLQSMSLLITSNNSAKDFNLANIYQKSIYSYKTNIHSQNLIPSRKLKWNI